MAAAPKTKDRPNKPGVAWRRALIVSLLVIALASAVYATQQIELFLIRDTRFALTPPAEYGEESPAVKLAGLKFASRSQVLRVFQQDVGRSLYLFPMEQRYKALVNIPWIKDASILRTWPNQIQVRVTERRPVAYVESRSESMSSWWLMDEDGVMLDPPARTAFDVPVLTGVRPDQTRAIRALRTRRMLRLLEDLGDYRKRISEVDVADLDNLRVTLKVEGKAVVLMLGDHNFHGRFQNFVDHYKEIQKRIAGVSALDLRLDRIITVPSGARHD